MILTPTPLCDPIVTNATTPFLRRQLEVCRLQPQCLRCCGAPSLARTPAWGGFFPQSLDRPPPRGSAASRGAGRGSDEPAAAGGMRGEEVDRGGRPTDCTRPDSAFANRQNVVPRGGFAFRRHPTLRAARTGATVGYFWGPTGAAGVGTICGRSLNCKARFFTAPASRSIARIAVGLGSVALNSSNARS